MYCFIEAGNGEWDFYNYDYFDVFKDRKTLSGDQNFCRK